MDQTKTDGALLSVSRFLVFSLCVVLSLGWLIAPEAVNWARNLVAAYVHMSPEQGVNRLPEARSTGTLPTALRGSSALQKVAASAGAQQPSVRSQ